MGPLGEDHQAPDLAARIRDIVQDKIVNARRRRTMRDLVHEIALHQNCPRSVVHSTVRMMIEDGFLEYRYTFGQSYLALSFRQPVALSPRFTIIPPDFVQDIPPPIIPIAIAPGVSFGDGRHPTTRLALQALDEWTYCQGWNPSVPPMVIDIGTGSGILAIAAAYLGAAGVIALDIDACARSEARHNIRLNPKIEGRVHVADCPLESIEQRFDLVMANLRLPTLAGLAGWVRDRLNPSACVVVSGCREDEWERLTVIYRARGLHTLWQGFIGGWAGGLLHLMTESISDRGAASPE